MTESAMTPERQLEAIFDNAFQFIGLLSPDGVVLRANRASLEAAGATEQEVIGVPFWETPWWSHSRDERERLRQAIERAAAGSFERFETTHLAVDGDTIPVDFSLTPVADDSSGVILLIPEGRRIRLSEADAEAQQRLQAVVDTAVEAIITIDRRGIINSFNRSAEEMFGYTVDEVLGRNVSMLMPSPYREEHDGYLERYLRTGEARIIGIGREVTAQRRDGSIFPMELAVSEIEDLGMFTGIIRDITDRKEAEERLRQADRLSSIGTLAAGLGHDMNNMLLPVRARLDLIDRMELPDNAHEQFVEIRKAARYLQDLADALHLLALDPDDHGASVETTDLHAWWQQTHTLLGRALPKSIRFAASIPEDLPLIDVAPHRLTQAVLNLFVNAGKAIESDGEVRLWADTDPARSIVRLGVTDDGCGMPKEVQRRALEPFFTTKTRGLGTGLGLSLVQSVALAADGTVEIESTPGAGTTIVLNFPASDEPSVESGGAEEAAVAAVAIEDPRMRSLVTSLLEINGFEVHRGAAEDHADARLWVCDASHATPAAASACIARGVVVVVVGPVTQEWNDVDAYVVHEPSEFETLRETIALAVEGIRS